MPKFASVTALLATAGSVALLWIGAAGAPVVVARPGAPGFPSSSAELGCTTTCVQFGGHPHGHEHAPAPSVETINLDRRRAGAGSAPPMPVPLAAEQPRTGVSLNDTLMAATMAAGDPRAVWDGYVARV